MGIINFKASNGFIQRFLKRNKLKKRTATHYLQNISNEVIENFKKIMILIRNERIDFLKGRYFK